MFLEANDEQWMLEMAKWQAETNAQSHPVTGAVQWLKSLAQQLVTGRSDEMIEDAEYLKIRDYINNLEDHLQEVHK